MISYEYPLEMSELLKPNTTVRAVILPNGRSGYDLRLLFQNCHFGGIIQSISSREGQPDLWEGFIEKFDMGKLVPHIKKISYAVRGEGVYRLSIALNLEQRSDPNRDSLCATAYYEMSESVASRYFKLEAVSRVVA